MCRSRAVGKTRVSAGYFLDLSESWICNHLELLSSPSHPQSHIIEGSSIHNGGYSNEVQVLERAALATSLQIVRFQLLQVICH